MRVSSKLWLLSLSCMPLSLSAAPVVIEESSFQELLNNPMTLNDDSQIKDYTERLWKKYKEQAQNDTERKKQHNEHALKFGDRTMKYSIDKIGNPGAKGYPVYIALHGGGGAPASVNDSQWHHMQIYYKSSVKSGIYIAPRGVTNTWNLHFVDESYPLYDRLIENLVAFENADPNQIYLLGFSAGGDGVYQVVPRMADRWAAANMSAGHHNWLAFDNLLNTPFLIQVGEYDGAYNRNKVAVENWLRLKTLRALHSGYETNVFVHAGRGHNGWYDNDPNERQHTVLKNPEAWLKSGDRTSTNTNTNAVRWLDQWKRSYAPSKLIWDLSTRAPRPHTWSANYVDKTQLRTNKNLFYWLAIEGSDPTSGRLEVERIPGQNTIKIHKAEGISDFKILVRKEDFDFNRPISIYYHNDKILDIQPSVKLSVMTQTLLERGDTNFLYHMEIPIHVLGLENEVEEGNSQELFSYCSEGRCSFMSADHFAKVRRFPLEMHYTCKNERHYALTFDDGPTTNSQKMLELLDRHNVKATFFVVGSHLQSAEGKQRIREMSAKGHQIANHSMTHASLPKLSRERMIQEVKDTQNLIVEALGNSKEILRDSSVVRPPFGNMSVAVQEVFQSIGFHSVRWNADRYDWKLTMKDKELLRQRFTQQLDFIDSSRSQAFNHSILDLNHEGSDVTLSVLDEMIPKIKAKGYEFVTVSDCIF